MSEHAALVSDWAMQNRLTLNVAKTKAIVVGSYFYINQLQGMETKGVQFGQTLVKFEKSVRTLGVVLDYKLNWKKQVSYICKRAFSLLYRLNFFCNSTTFYLRRHLIKTLLFPILDYCSLVWCDISQEMDRKLQTIMNAGISTHYTLQIFAPVAHYRRKKKVLYRGTAVSHFCLWKALLSCTEIYCE